MFLRFFFQTCLLFTISFALSSCGAKEKNTLFSQLPSSASGIHFNNEIRDTDSSYSFINEFGYMGGGVGIGDFNNDGLKDIYFSGNQVSSRLYINKGKNKFDDITEKAGVATNVWATGVSIADVNSDGFDDIYICVFGKDLKTRAENLLFINQHNLTFKESAAEYGLADTSYSTQAAFFDYDKDGDLDMYLVNYLLTDRNANTIYPRDRSGFSIANDKLYRNDGDTLKKGHPFFSDITLEAGIKEDGYGLGVSISDFNNDGWPDVYVADDFLSNDNLWLNNQNGTFTNCISRSLQHQSYSSMGVDAADINNDALADIVTLDMLPEDNQRRKTSFSFMNYERYETERQMGYEPEFMRNMLQLNNGNYLSGDTIIPFFSEIGQLAGIHATDWSWSVLLADFNNDGWKDIHVTNGIGRDFINADFLEFSNEIFNTIQTKEEREKAIRKKLSSLDHVNLSNYLYINQGGLKFADSSVASGISESSMSNGAAYVDLDNDGDLDLVINNISKEAYVFINNTIKEEKDQSAFPHYLSIKLQGDNLNIKGIGAKIIVYNQGNIQVQEQYPIRGYFSSVDQQLLFGLGNEKRADSLKVIWPDGKTQVLSNVVADTLLTISWSDALESKNAGPAQNLQLFKDITSASGIAYKHRDVSFNDYSVQRLLPQKYSQLGPFIATADINNDGYTDFFVGGGFNSSGKIFTQQKRQTFSFKNITDSIKLEEDMDCVLFDADKDGDADLLITSGDVMYEAEADYYLPRFYVNDGKGNFKLQKDAIPASVKTIAGCVTTGDYDGDGDMDVFIGGRVSKTYPISPRSYLLQNNNGVFSDVTEKVCPSLMNPGMITSAIWADMDNDKQIDLIVAGEWMPIRIFKNNKGLLTEAGGNSGLNDINGMWRSLVVADIDNDGDPDLVAGNLGLNCDYRVSDDMPMELFATDMDGNGSIDPIPFYYIKGKDGKRHSYPAISRGMFASQVPAVKKQFLLNSDYANASFDAVFKGKPKESMLSLYCNETASCYFENSGNGRFIKHVLPVEAQFAPVNAILVDDFDNDGYKDLLLAGNEYQTEVMTGRYDASYGLLLKGTGNKDFQPVSPVKSGFIIKGDIKDMSLLQLANGEKVILAAVNNDSLRVFRINNNK